MKAVLISIQPKWCEFIASGEKTVEVRKSKPKLETPFKVYIYCTKDEPMYYSGEKFWCTKAGDFGNGKVIGEFVCDEIIVDERGENADILRFYGNLNKTLYGWRISDLVIYDKPRELREFEKPWKEWIDANGAWHDIRPCQCGKSCVHAMFDYGENTEICGIDYDGENCPYIKIKRPPQSWCYVEEQK